MKKICLMIAVLAAMLTLTGSALADGFNVLINTSSLPNSPFTLDFYVFDGSGAADTTVNVSNLNLGGGSFNGSSNLFGSASGDASTSFSLNDSSGFGQLTQSFNPGSFVSFFVTFVSAGSGGGVPDLFAFLIDELNSTDGSGGNSLVTAQFVASTPDVSAFSATTYVATGNVVQGVNAVVTVPEPASMTLLGGGMLVTALRRKLKSKNK
jgi:hypothetical protein